MDFQNVSEEFHSEVDKMLDRVTRRVAVSYLEDFQKVWCSKDYPVGAGESPNRCKDCEFESGPKCLLKMFINSHCEQ